MTQLGLEPRISRLPDGGIVVTQSDIASFKADRRGWMLGNYLGLQSRHQPVYGPLRLGTRVHSALEMYYGYGHDLVESYIEIAKRELEQIIESGIVFDQTAWRKEADLGRVMLAGYEEWLAETGADRNLEVVSAEEKLTHTVDIDGTPVELRGKIDLRAKDTFTGMNLVIDWKTTANMQYLAQAAAKSEQLLTYMLLERLVNKDKPDYYLQGARFVMFRKVTRTASQRPPFYDIVEVRHNDTRLRNFWTQLHGVLRDYVYVVKSLDAGVDHRLVAYPNPSTNHRWSIFNPINEMLDDGSHVEAMIADLYRQSDPHARYEKEPASLLDTLE